MHGIAPESSPGAPKTSLSRPWWPSGQSGHRRAGRGQPHDTVHTDADGYQCHGDSPVECAAGGRRCHRRRRQRQKDRRGVTPGTSFILTSGTHQLFSVIPLPGDALNGQPGTVLDGEHTVLTAFKVPHGGTADGVQIIGASPSSPLVVEDYGKNSHSQVGAIQSNSQTPTPRPFQRSLAPVGGGDRQLLTGDLGVRRHGHLPVPGRVERTARGIGGGGNGVTIDQSTVSDNGLTVNRLGWEAGGIKTVASNVLIEHDTISGNGAPGIWT